MKEDEHTLIHAGEEVRRGMGEGRGEEAARQNCWLGPNCVAHAATASTSACMRDTHLRTLTAVAHVYIADSSSLLVCASFARLLCV